MQRDNCALLTNEPTEDKMTLVASREGGGLLIDVSK